jgi:hypothetical protein
MPRTTTTRRKTREIAEQKLQNGVDLSKITVDLVLSEIRQGSRTTINDELTRWKQDQLNVLGLLLEIPTEVRNSISETWAALRDSIVSKVKSSYTTLEHEVVATRTLNSRLVADADHLQHKLEECMREVDSLRTLNAELQEQVAFERKKRDLLIEKHSSLEAQMREQLVLTEERFDVLNRMALVEMDRARQQNKKQAK